MSFPSHRGPVCGLWIEDLGSGQRNEDYGLSSTVTSAVPQLRVCLPGGRAGRAPGSSALIAPKKHFLSNPCEGSEQMAAFLSCRVSGGGGGRKPNQ